MLGESRIATAEGRPIFGSNHVYHGMTMCSARRPLFGMSERLTIDQKPDRILLLSDANHGHLRDDDVVIMLTKAEVRAVKYHAT